LVDVTNGVWSELPDRCCHATVAQQNEATQGTDRSDVQMVIAADAIEAERDALLAQLRGVGEECSDLKAQTARLVEQLQRVGQENVDLKAQTARLVEQLQSVGQDNVGLKAQTARLVQQLQSVGQENVGLKRRLPHS
jgi:septal ring factor EnvC (AmiA/AmiB activator)